MDEILTPMAEAAQCWCDPRTSSIGFDVRLAAVFAEKIQALRAQDNDKAELIQRQVEQITVLQADRDSWKATAEEAMDKNVDQGLLQRHEMREAGMRKQLADAKVDVRVLTKALRAVHPIINVAPTKNRRVIRLRQQVDKALARPGVVALGKEEHGQ